MKTKYVILLSLIATTLNANPLLSDDINANNAGLKLYEEKKYDEAVKEFAKVKEPKNKSTMRFNSSTGLYKNKDFNGSEKELSEAIKNTEGKTLAESLFNLGNTKFNQGDVNSALKAYQSAVDYCEGFKKDLGEKFCDKLEEDAVNNMQFIFNNKNQAKNNQKQQKDKDKNKDKKDGGGGGQDNKDKKDDQKKDKKDDKSKDNKDNKKEDGKGDKPEDNKDQGNKDEQKQQDQQQQQQKAMQSSGKADLERRISPQQASQLLKIIDSSDNNIQKQMMQRMYKNKVKDNPTEKDW